MLSLRFGLSKDELPPPARIRNSNEQNIAKSVRASLTVYQKPWLALTNSGTFVVAMAIVITMSSGTAVTFVQKPNSTKIPHTISKVPTKCAAKEGCGNPIFVKRATPILESMYLRMPCVKKISPTATRMSATNLEVGGLAKGA
jgi:hypothetical protein